MTIELVLALSTFGFLCQALEIRWHIGRLTIQPGWVGLTIWGALAALRAAQDTGEEGGTVPPNVLLVLGVAIVVGVVTIIAQTRQVHTLVNDKSDKQIERIDQLVTTLEAADVAVPKRLDDKSL
jgi:hypothetical protein